MIVRLCALRSMLNDVLEGHSMFLMAYMLDFIYCVEIDFELRDHLCPY